MALQVFSHQEVSYQAYLSLPYSLNISRESFYFHYISTDNSDVHKSNRNVNKGKEGLVIDLGD